MSILCLKLNHIWERFLLGKDRYKRCSRCHVTQLDDGSELERFERWQGEFLAAL